MLIQEALKETGLATVGGAENSWHIHWNSLDSCFYRTYENGKIERYKMGMKALSRDDWQPYHEAEEIRPEKAGELWRAQSGCYWFTYENERRGTLEFIPSTTGNATLVINPMSIGSMDGPPLEIIHNKNGWERLFPKPEDNSVERIEIEDVLWNTTKNHTYPYQEEPTFDWDELLNMKPVKLICVIPKEG
jgi:hypothetical protein